MIIYFSGSARGMQDNIELYRRIIRKIREMGHVISNEWVETAWQRDEKGEKDWNLTAIVEDALASIENAEVLIVEASGGSAFGVGYEVAYAVERKKPILLLVNKTLLPDSYAAGIKHELITYKNYDTNNLEKIIGDFIDANTLEHKDLRFNFVIDRRLHNHLRWRSFKTGKTKAEVVRDLLLKDMDNTMQ